MSYYLNPDILLQINNLEKLTSRAGWSGAYAYPALPKSYWDNLRSILSDIPPDNTIPAVTLTFNLDTSLFFSKNNEWIKFTYYTDQFWTYTHFNLDKSYRIGSNEIVSELFRNCFFLEISIG